MPSERQIEANRQNASKSTGPRSEAGRTQASHNALKHGLAAQQVILPGESAPQFEALHAQVLDECAPVGAIERELAEQIAVHLWRLRRVPEAEAGVLAYAQAQTEQEAARARLKAIEDRLYDDPVADLTDLKRLRTDAAGLSPGERRGLEREERQAANELRAAEDKVRASSRTLGRAFATDAARYGILNKLSRYAGTIERSLFRVTRELERLQRNRREMPENTHREPHIIDMDCVSPERGDNGG